VNDFYHEGWQNGNITEESASAALDETLNDTLCNTKFAFPIL